MLYDIVKSPRLSSIDFLNEVSVKYRGGMAD